ncbi:MAG: hypothetical protein LBI59_08410 [Candidatus Accumulibacter sp.]|jgi:hypothetical protein|nr:hypothetical protein [Accumulibacter sp.]
MGSHGIPHSRPDTFTTSLARLTGDEQKAAKTTPFDLQIDPVSKETDPFRRPDAQPRR